MSEVAIRVEGLGKRYRIGAHAHPYRTLRESLTDVFMAPWRRRSTSTQKGAGASGEADEIWALRNVSFEVAPGSVLGVIGRNGAGKSTLLKILSRITSPTEGRAEIRGRVGSLLEVGTGFHPELTGRENVFLSGAILGMRRAELRARFDDIVAFAEVERFIDTPVKHFSSGMYLRLAFAVAAHLNPDILLVDEVLAVGDAAFQKRCLGKMEEVSRFGRTVLFISHNMPAVARLCPRTIVLENGGVLRDAPTHEAVAAYLRFDGGTAAERVWTDGSDAPGDEIMRLRAVRVRRADGGSGSTIDIRDAVGIEIDYRVVTAGHVLVPNIHMYNQEGVCAFAALDVDPEWRRRTKAVGDYRTTAWIPGNTLAEGLFVVSAAVSTLVPERIHVYEREVVAFQVIDCRTGDSSRGDYAGTFPGVMRPMLRWTTEQTPQ